MTRPRTSPRRASAGARLREQARVLRDEAVAARKAGALGRQVARYLDGAAAILESGSREIDPFGGREETR